MPEMPPLSLPPSPVRKWSSPFKSVVAASVALMAAMTVSCTATRLMDCCGDINIEDTASGSAGAAAATAEAAVASDWPAGASSAPPAAAVDSDWLGGADSAPSSQSVAAAAVVTDARGTGAEFADKGEGNEGNEGNEGDEGDDNAISNATLFCCRRPSSSSLCFSSTASSSLYRPNFSSTTASPSPRSSSTASSRPLGGAEDTLVFCSSLKMTSVRKM
mmetsp:Transcript_14926/g.36698  ORF Transcript_14926/g.36698 Transcript_14926/m.36698 type:complete len:218 (-) Transcript_14926:90-743(-)